MTEGRKQRVYVKIQCSIFNYRKTNNLREITLKISTSYTRLYSQMTEPFLAAKCPLFDTGTESRSLFTLSGHCTPKQHIRSRRPLFKVAHRASASCFPLKHSVFSFLIFKLKDNCFPEFCGFLSYTTKNQHRYTHVPAPSPLPFSLSQKPCLTSLNHTAKSHWLSVLHIVL